MKIIIKDFIIEKIPILEVYSQNNETHNSLLIITHGSGGKKEVHLNLAYQYAKKNIIVILFDLDLHGKLETKKFRNLTKAEKVSLYPEVIDKSSEYIKTIINYYLKHDKVKIDKIGLLGFSMGGFVIFNYLTKYSAKNISTVVTIISTPSWLSSFTNSLYKYPNAKKYITQEILDYVKSNQSSNNIENLTNIPLLMLNGENDEMFSMNDLKIVATKIKNTHKNNKNFKLIIYKNIGHEVLPEMIEESKKWILKYL